MPGADDSYHYREASHSQQACAISSEISLRLSFQERRKTVLFVSRDLLHKEAIKKANL
jgi:hypothetical protein